MANPLTLFQVLDQLPLDVVDRNIIKRLGRSGTQCLKLSCKAAAELVRSASSCIRLAKLQAAPETPLSELANQAKTIGLYSTAWGARLEVEYNTDVTPLAVSPAAVFVCSSKPPQRHASSS